MITHLTRAEGEESLHLSHLYHYISAWEWSKDEQADFAMQIEEALKTAKKTVQTQIVVRDGECSLHITPTGYIILMLPWKTYKVKCSE